MVFAQRFIQGLIRQIAETSNAKNMANSRNVAKKALFLLLQKGAVENRKLSIWISEKNTDKTQVLKQRFRAADIHKCLNDQLGSKITLKKIAMLKANEIYRLSLKKNFGQHWYLLSKNKTRI